MRTTPALIVLALSAALPAMAQSPQQNAAASIQARQTHYKEIGKSTKGINDELKSAAPSVASIQRYARTIATYGPQITTWFPHGTGSEAGVKTAAKAEIWAKPQEFAKDANDFKLESAAFYATAQKGDLGAIKAEFPKLGATCKACHDEFRVRDEH